MDLVAIHPLFNLYNQRWPIRTGVDPRSAGEVRLPRRGPRARRHRHRLDWSSHGCIISGGRIHRSVLSARCRVNSFSEVEESVLFENVRIGRHAKIRRCIIDKDVEIPAGRRDRLQPRSGPEALLRHRERASSSSRSARRSTTRRCGGCDRRHAPSKEKRIVRSDGWMLGRTDHHRRRRPRLRGRARRACSTARVHERRPPRLRRRSRSSAGPNSLGVLDIARRTGAHRRSRQPRAEAPRLARRPRALDPRRDRREPSDRQDASRSRARAAAGRLDAAPDAADSGSICPSTALRVVHAGHRSRHPVRARRSPTR